MRKYLSIKLLAYYYDVMNIVTGDGREIMKLAKVLRIVGYSAVKLATVPLLLSPLHKYMDWCVFSLSMFTAIIF